MMITTGYGPAEAQVQTAQRLSEETGCSYVCRKKLTIPALSARYSNRDWLVVTSEGLRFASGAAEPLFFHPSMAAIRVKRLLNGESDSLLRVSRAAAGDTVLDCTAGLASDAIVFSHAVGSAGQVTALESSYPLYLLIREGLQRYSADYAELEVAMRRIHVKHADHLAYMRDLPDRSTDIVYFDPMFRAAVQDSRAIAPLRDAADHRPLDRRAVEEAMRITRKTIVLKEHRESGEFERLGFSHVHRTSSRIAYGVITCDNI